MLLWAFLACVGSCTNLPVATEDAKAPDVFDRIGALDLLPRQPLPVDQNAQIGGNRSKPVLYTGVVVPATVAGGRGQQSGGPDGAGGGEGYELNFENTPIAMVAKAVLGDILGLGYAVDPRVQGTISLSSGRAVPKSDLLYVLESVLRMNNIVLVRDGSTTYRLIPLGDATGGGNTDSVAGRTENPHIVARGARGRAGAGRRERDQEYSADGKEAVGGKGKEHAERGIGKTHCGIQGFMGLRGIVPIIQNAPAQQAKFAAILSLLYLAFLAFRISVLDQLWKTATR